MGDCKFQIIAFWVMLSSHCSLMSPSNLFSGYVAASGLPEPREDVSWILKVSSGLSLFNFLSTNIIFLQHAVAMALFARDIVRKMRELVKQLETKLGPDTGDLALRVGLNSGRTYCLWELLQNLLIM